MITIKSATAQYTGGSIYIYYGKLEDGTYFRAVDNMECIEICDADTGTEDADYQEFYDEHRLRTIEGADFHRFWNRMIDWILKNSPDGNYMKADLKIRLLDPAESC